MSETSTTSNMSKSNQTVKDNDVEVLYDCTVFSEI